MHVISLKRCALSVVATTIAVTGLAVVEAAPSSAAQVPCQRSYTHTVAQAITDENTTSDVIDVPEDGLVVTRATVTANIHHTSDDDLIVGVQSMTDTFTGRAFVLLFDQYGGGGDNLIGTTWADDAASPISWGDAPFTGRFKGVRPLAAMNGFSGGKYELDVSDMATGDTGTLDSWTLTLTYAGCDFDSDGVEDHADRCLGVSAHTASGCPLTTRALTAKYKHGKFQGVMSSPVAGCKASQPVTVWKVRRGADKLVGTATTRSDGSYKLTHAKHAGRYYATSPRVAVTDQAECPAVTSSTFRIR